MDTQGPFPKITHDDIEQRFGYHRATFPETYDPGDVGFKTRLANLAGDHDESGELATAPLHALAREKFIAAADALIQLVPPGREQALALTALQEASMWANAAIAMTAPLVKE